MRAAVALALAGALAAPILAATQIALSPWPHRCSRVSTPPAEFDNVGVRTIEASLYLAILQLDPVPGTSTQPPIVEAVTIPIQAIGSNRGRNFVDTLPKDLKPAARDGVDQCFPQTADRFPAATRLVPIEELNRVMNLHGPIDWRSFVATFDAAKMWYGLSRAVLSNDRRDAIVFYERISGCCGVGAMVWFQRPSLDRPWTVKGRMPFWMG